MDTPVKLEPKKDRTEPVLMDDIQRSALSRALVRKAQARLALNGAEELYTNTNAALHDVVLLIGGEGAKLQQDGANISVVRPVEEPDGA